MRPAIEVWWEAGKAAANCVFGSMEMPDVVAAAVIEADRAELVREIVAELRGQSVDKQDREWMGPLDIADYIETKFGCRK